MSTNIAATTTTTKRGMTSLALDKDTYSAIVYEYNGILKEEPKIAVDSVRFYLISRCFPVDIKGICHSSISEDKHNIAELGNPQWGGCFNFNSSNDGQYISFAYSDQVSADGEELQLRRIVRWFAPISESENGKLESSVIYDGDYESSVGPFLSRDGQTLCIYSYRPNLVARVYRVREEAGKDAVIFMQCELNGRILAVSGKGNRIMIETAEEKIEIYDITRKVSELVCQINITDSYLHECALNEDGSEAAFTTSAKELQIVKVNKVVGDKVDQPVIVALKVSNLGDIDKLMYSDGNKLYLCQNDKVWLCDPLTNELTLLCGLQNALNLFGTAAISPNADYIAILEQGNRGENGTEWRVTVRRKLEDAAWKKPFWI